MVVGGGGGRALWATVVVCCCMAGPRWGKEQMDALRARAGRMMSMLFGRLHRISGGSHSLRRPQPGGLRRTRETKSHVRCAIRCTLACIPLSSSVMQTGYLSSPRSQPNKREPGRTPARRLFLNLGCVLLLVLSTGAELSRLANGSLILPPLPGFTSAYVHCRSYRCCVLCSPYISCPDNPVARRVSFMNCLGRSTPHDTAST